LLIHQDARIFLASLDEGKQVSHEMKPGRHAWLQVLRGAVSLNGHDLMTSDGAAISDEQSLEILATTDAEIMLFDLA
jgi:redox-sensitive bicupin YhaK (pirin superfamily)